MIKKDIARLLRESHGGMTLEEADHYVNVFLEILKDAAARGNVTIPGFGRFRHKRGVVREVIMPDGNRCLTSAADRLQFLPSPKLKASLNANPLETP